MSLLFCVSGRLQGPQPQIGELAAIRFKGSFNNVVFDDVYKSREPLYYRVGGGTLLKVGRLS
jgi:hypothetical protein